MLTLERVSIREIVPLAFHFITLWFFRSDGSERTDEELLLALIKNKYYNLGYQEPFVVPPDLWEPDPPEHVRERWVLHWGSYPPPMATNLPGILRNPEFLEVMPESIKRMVAIPTAEELKMSVEPIHGPYRLEDLGADSFEQISVARAVELLEEYVRELDPSLQLAQLQLDNQFWHIVASCDSSYKLVDRPSNYRQPHSGWGLDREVLFVSRKERILVDAALSAD